MVERARKNILEQPLTHSPQPQLIVFLTNINTLNLVNTLKYYKFAMSNDNKNITNKII